MLSLKGLFTKVDKRNKTSYVINGSNILLALASAGLVLLFSSIMYLCGAMFSCRKFLPTLSYTGIFLGLDRHMMIALSLIMTTLIAV
jgi:hypothetical protein